MAKLPPEFNFAGFTWPRYLAVLPTGSLRARLKARANRCTSGYYHKPSPSSTGKGFYLGDEGNPFALRYEMTGPEYYYADDGFETIQGVIFRLPKGRGFLAGWTMGERMASSVDYRIYETEREARRAAESEAECVAENQRQHEWEERERLETEEREATEEYERG